MISYFLLKVRKIPFERSPLQVRPAAVERSASFFGRYLPDFFTDDSRKFLSAIL